MILLFKFRMSQNKCPIVSCGRVFENASVLKQHLERRHGNVNVESFIPKNQQQRVMHQQVNKLPKIKKLKLMEGEYKLPEVYRRSSSKNNKQILINTTLNKSKIVSAIGQSKKVAENTENNQALKRPSVSKKNNSTILPAQNEKLPQVKPANKIKLQKLPEASLKLTREHKSQMQKNAMNITAPNFKNLIKKQISGRERSRDKKGTNSILQEDTSYNKKDNNDLLFIKTQQGFNQKFSKLHKQIEKRQYKKKSEPSKESLESKEDLIQQQSPKKQKSLPKKEQKAVQNEKIAQIVEKALKQEDKLTAKTKTRRQIPPKKTDSKKQIASLTQYNFQERIVVFQPNIGPKLVLPPTARLQFLYANNCKLSSINLNNIQHLRQISIQHNSIKDLSFLNYQNNSSIQKIFADHNQLSTLDYLPPYLQVLSVGFNNISGLQINAKQLSRIGSLQEIDFSFNPVRKENNYKLHVLGNCFQLKKIDGIKITRFDLELAAEYNKIVDEELGLIPSNKFRNLIVSKFSNSPSTEISYGDAEIEQGTYKKSEDQLEKQIQKLQKVIRSTKNHLNIISEENDIIKSQILTLRQECVQIEANPQALFDKLRNECAALELLLFLQQASEEQLQELIIIKKRQLSIQ